MDGRLVSGRQVQSQYFKFPITAFFINHLVAVSLHLGVLLSVQESLSDWIVNMRLPSDDCCVCSIPRPINKTLANQPFPVINGRAGCAPVLDGQKIA
jgi:hypothetical protein